MTGNSLPLRRRRRKTDEDLEALFPVASFQGFAAATEVVVFRDRVVVETVDRRNLRRQQEVFPMREMDAPEFVRGRGTLSSIRFRSGTGRQLEVVFASSPAAREARDVVLRLMHAHRA
jgi:hypothetical protein